MEGDPVLFGSLPGVPKSCVMEVSNPDDGANGRVKIQVFLANRRDPMWLVIDDLPADRMASAIGYVIPLALKVHYVNTSQLRRHFWAVYRTLSLAGWAPGIKGCGAQKG